MKARAAGPLVWLSILAVTLFILIVFKNFLWLVVPIFFAIAAYYMLEPVSRSLMLTGLSPTHSSRVIMLAAALVILAIILSLFPGISDRSQLWQTTMSRYLEGGTAFVDKTLKSLEDQSPYCRKIHLQSKVSISIKEFSDRFVDAYLADIAIELAKWIPSLLLVPYLTYFMLVDGRSLKQYLLRAVPNAFF